MVLSFHLHDRYSWVLLVGVGTGWLTAYQTMNVSKLRKAADIRYPQLYAEKEDIAMNREAAMKFNCAQRAHGNTLEVLPQTLFYLLFSGLRYPTTAATLGATWVLGRVLYTIGYSTGDPHKRRGFIQGFAYIGLQLLSTWTAIELAWPTLQI